jgi:eukaryotic-like serine/threonine-protein kinase
MQERAIFIEALQKADPTMRAAFLEAACGRDDGLRARVERLLVEHERQESFFLDSPPPDVSPTTDQPLAERPGTQIGPYKLLQVIGEGGMGTVYMAEQIEPVQRQVALKVIKAGMDSQQVIARFEAERQALAMMDHVNIARVLDVGTTQSGRPYFVMELVHGVPITKYCDDNHLTPRQRLELFVPVCQAIQHAHQKGIIHRDIKPSNVMVTLYDGRPVAKVIDFGVAKATEQKLTERTLFTQYGTMVGTLEYMSPEQAEMSALGVDTRSDIFSLGVLLYELLTGSTPLSHKRVREAAFGEILRLIREEEPPKPSTRLSDSGEALASISANRHTEPAKLAKLVRGELDWIVMKCLDKDRNRRYETASGFAADVQRYLSDEPVQACPPSALYKFTKFARRNKAPLITAALLSAALLLASVISTWQALRARQAEALAQSRLEAEKEAREQAVTEAAKATAISAVLQEALQSSNPYDAKGADYTVRQLLDDLSQAVGDRLKDQPQADAAIHATIGNAYSGLSLPQDAEPHLLKALELRRRLLGPNHIDVARSLFDHSMNAVESGNLLVAESDAREALAIFQKINDKSEQNLGAFERLAFCLGLQRKVAEQQAIADQAFIFAQNAGYTDSPSLAALLHNLAHTRIESGDPAGGEQMAVKAVAMHRRVNGNDHPQTGWALCNLGFALERQEKYGEAETRLREALTIFRKHFEESHKSIHLTSDTLQRVLTKKGDQVALAAFLADKTARVSKALELQVSNVRLRIYLGKLLRDAGDFDGALVQFSEVITRNPKLADAWTARATLYLRTRQFAQAAEDCSQAIELKPDGWEGWSFRAFAHFHRQQWDESIRDFTKAIDLAPQVHTNWFHRGHIYLQLGQWDKAAADFTKVIEGWPDEPRGWHLRALAYAQLDQSDKAIADLRQAIAKGFDNVESIKNDPRLAPLRTRDDFAALLEDLERKQ